MKGILRNWKVKIRKSNTYLIEILGGENREDDEEPISKDIMDENFPELKKELIRFIDYTKPQAGLKKKITLTTS